MPTRFSPGWWSGWTARAGAGCAVTIWRSSRPGGPLRRGCLNLAGGVRDVALKRVNRVGEAIKEEVSRILQRELKDPRIGFCSVVDVEVSSDLRHAKVFVSVLGDEAAKQATLAGLESARGFIRTEIGRRIRLRHTPEVVFRLDSSIERGARVSQLLNEIRREGTEGGA
ncbi:MAG: 30S ribosome-binding factor RbfA [Acetobacteraceae bacterium]|nr:30S ribosome-binding factor RbfA [Acetobacteraceae bacterium]